jgi:hypothetical protein
MVLSLAVADRAQGQRPPPYEGAVSIADDPQFGNQRETLRRLVQRNGRRGRHDLCVIGEELNDGSRQAWVLWRQGRAIILWTSGLAPEFADLWLSRRYLRVPRDVAVDPRGSSYIVTPDWVASLRQACEQIGQHFTIIKR